MRKMNKKECKIVQDLLPNYMEGLTSEETNQYIQTHVAQCDDCSTALAGMKEKISVNTDTVEKNKVNYLKKYNRELRVLQIIILIILIAFIVNVGRKYMIIDTLHKQCMETAENLDNYHYRREGYSNIANRSMYVQETYYKDGNFITTHTVISEDGQVREFIFYKKNEEITLLARTILEGKVTETDMQYDGEIENVALIPLWHCGETIHQKLYHAIFSNITQVEINSNLYYIIQPNYSGQYENLYIDADTGLCTKTVALADDYMSNNYYEFGTVEDSDIVIPDASGV